MSYQIAIVSDCYEQALGRMQMRVQYFNPDAVIVCFTAASAVEAGGNIIDALDANLDGDGAVLCNSAPREQDREINGSRIVYGQIGAVTLVSTLGVLGLVKQMVPDLAIRALDVERFMSKHWGEVGRGGRFSFRGLEVIPRALYSIRAGRDLTGVSTEVAEFPVVDPCVWLVDSIKGRPTNLKLSVIRDKCAGFKAGRSAILRIAGQTHELTCYDRLTDIQHGGMGIYEGSSGLGQHRFLEIAVMGGSAAEALGVFESGAPIAINFG